MYIHSPRIVTDGLVLCLDAASPLSYRGGDTWQDLSNYGKHATTNNVDSRFIDQNGGGVVFNDTNSNTFIVDNPLDTANATLEVVCQAADLTIQHMAWGFPNGSSQRLYVGYNSTWDIGIQSSMYGTTTIPRTLDPIHLTCTLDNGTATLWANGVPRRTKNYTLFSTAGTVMALGNNGVTSNIYWDGVIYLFRTYNRVLSSQEILNNFNATKGRFGL